MSPRTTGSYITISHGTVEHIVGSQRTFVEPTRCLFSFLLPCGPLSPLLCGLPCIALPSWPLAHYLFPLSMRSDTHCFPNLINVALTGFQLRSNHPGLGICPALPLSELHPSLDSVVAPNLKIPLALVCLLCGGPFPLPPRCSEVVQAWGSSWAQLRNKG